MSIDNRDIERGPHERTLGMRTHIRWPLIPVTVGWVAVRSKPIHNSLQIMTNVRITVFINRQPTARMLYKKVEHTHRGKLRQLPHHLSCHQMKPSWKRAKLKSHLFYHLSILLSKPCGFISRIIEQTPCMLNLQSRLLLLLCFGQQQVEQHAH